MLEQLKTSIFESKNGEVIQKLLKDGRFQFNTYTTFSIFPIDNENSVFKSKLFYIIHSTPEGGEITKEQFQDMTAKNVGSFSLFYLVVYDVIKEKYEDTDNYGLFCVLYVMEQ